MKYKATTNKLFNSRIIKFSIFGILILLFLKIISFAMTSWLIILINNIEPEYEFKINAFLKIVDLLTVPISGAIATIITAVIARYGLREASGNVASGIINKNTGQDTTTEIIKDKDIPFGK